MNFLAHAYLSGENEQILLGNFMGDFIKGKKYTQYPKNIGIGVLLHREIDSFTDQHPQVKISKQKLYATTGHYASVVVDIFYDHFLIQHWEKFSAHEINFFIQHVHQIAEKFIEKLPDKAQKMLPYMIEHNWLKSYGSFKGLERSLSGISRRSPYNPSLQDSLKILHEEYESFNEDFLIFFPALISHATAFREYLTTQTWLT